jgi:hypothetical protein
VSVGGAIFQNRWKRLTDRQVAAGRIPAPFAIPASEAERAAEAIRALPVTVRRAYQDVMAGSIQTVWIFLAVVSAAALILGLLMRNLKLDSSAVKREGDYDTERLP